MYSLSDILLFIYLYSAKADDHRSDGVDRSLLYINTDTHTHIYIYIYIYIYI